MCVSFRFTLVFNIHIYTRIHIHSYIPICIHIHDGMFEFVFLIHGYICIHFHIHVVSRSSQSVEFALLVPSLRVHCCVGWALVKTASKQALVQLLPKEARCRFSAAPIFASVGVNCPCAH